MKQSTLKKYLNILKAVKNSGLSLSAYCKEANISYRNITKTICNLKKQNNEESEMISELLSLYNEVTSGSRKNNVNYYRVEDTKQESIGYSITTSASTDKVEDNFGISLVINRDSENKIKNYTVKYPTKNGKSFITILSREDSEVIFGLYTYYGGNITARNVANEFPKYTLSEIKKIFRCFSLTKDSIWAPPHLVEELSSEQLAQYRMQLKERAAFKYADAKQERDFKNSLNKMASKIIQLENKQSVLQELSSSNINIPNFQIPPKSVLKSHTFILYLSDLHIGGYNEKYGYVELETYDEEEIKRRLYKVFEYLSTKSYDNIIVVNLGDSVDSYNKQTTRGGHELPGILSNKEQSQLYLNVMLWFFKGLQQYCSSIQYYCIGESNHDGDWGWINNVALSAQLNNINIQTYISNKPIDKFDVNEVSIVYLHGKDISNQFKGFPLVLNEKTENWFNSYFIDSKLTWKSRICVVKGDLHQPAFTNCSTFDYISCPSLYGSSQYIVANFGKTKWGIMYMEIDSNNNILNGLIRD